MSIWGATTTDRNDFYPWVHVDTPHSFRIHISENERLYMFPMYFGANSFWTEGNKTKINLELHNSKGIFELSSRYIRELNRTYWTLRSSKVSNEQYDIIYSQTDLKLPIDLTCYVD